MPDNVTAMMAGMAMGFVGSIPLTGPIALLVFHRALQARFARGFAVGIGGAVGPSKYSLTKCSSELARVVPT